jgi:hypothetical protein
MVGLSDSSSGDEDSINSMVWKPLDKYPLGIQRRLLWDNVRFILGR